MSDYVQQDGILKNGFGLSPKTVMRDQRLSIEAKAIYAYIASFAGAGMVAFPSVDLICRDLKISKNRYFTHRKNLVDCGYVVIRRERKESGFSCNIYTLAMNPVCLQNVDIGIEDVGNVDIGNKDTNNNSSNNNNSNSNSNKNTSSSTDDRSPYSEAFENWWSIYPRKIGKGKAYKIWAKDKLDKRVDGLIEKLSQQNAMQFAFTEDKFIPHASTYLSEARYDDEIEQRGSANETNFTSNQQIDRTTARNRKLQEEWNRLQNNEERDGDVIPDLEVHGRQLRPTLDN